MNNANDRHYKRALEQTISDEQFNSDAIKKLAETLSDDECSQHVQAEMVDSILLDTLAEPADDEDVDGARLTDRTFSHEQEALDSTQVKGRYQIRSVLGTGATGQVFAVYDQVFEREIAIKFLHPKLVTNERKMLQFLNEARITARLAHQNILPIHDIDYTEGALIYFSMAKADGRTLSELIAEATESPTVPDNIAHFNDRVRIILQVCHAISYAHSQDIIHKDIKPSNIMVGPYGEVLVVDWGTASYEMKIGEKTGLVGTPVYMSPEQARREKADKLSDIYCIGSTFYHLLTFQYPCYHQDIDTFWEMKKNGALNTPDRKTLKAIPKQLYNIAIKAMAARREDRYQQVEDIIADLEAYQHGRSISAYQETVWELFARIYKYNKVVFYLTLCCIAAIIASGAWLYLERQQAFGDWTTVAEQSRHTTDLNSMNAHWELGTADELSQEPIPLLEDNSTNHGNVLRLTQGMLYITPPSAPQSKSVALRYKNRVPGNMHIAWKHSLLYPDKRIEFFLGGDTSDTAYHFILAPSQGSLTLTLRKYDRLVDSRSLKETLLPNHTYTLAAEKSYNSVSLSLNGKNVYVYDDPEILTGSKHQRFGFIINEHTTANINDIHIRRQASPARRLPITIANDYYSNQLYADALEQYKQIRQNYPNTSMSETALYMKARCLSGMSAYQEAAKAYQQFLGFYNNDALNQYAATYYITALGRLGKWADCQRLLARYHDGITQTGLRLLLINELEAATAVPDPDKQAIQDDLIRMMRQYFKD